MTILILLSCYSIMVSAVPVSLDVLPPQLSQGRVVEATNQLRDAHTLMTPAPLSPNVEIPQPGVPQQPGPLGGPQFLPSMQHYTWPPLGGSPMLIPLQQSILGSQIPANQPIHSQQPLMFPPYRYFPLVSSSYMNQLFSPYGFPMILQSPLPAHQPPNSPALPAVTPSGAAPSEDTPQNPQIIYMLQQPKSSPLGSLSSEELQMAAKMDQLGVYLSTVLTNLPAGAIQPVSQGAGLVNPEQRGVVPTVGTSSAAVPQTQGPVSSGPQPNTNGLPVGLETATVQAAVSPTAPITY